MPIHPTAIIASDAQIDTDVEIGAYTVVGEGVSMGKGCRIGPHVVIQGPTTIGSDNQIFQFASIGAAPQDLKYKGEPTRLEIGDRNVFREYVTVHAATNDGDIVTYADIYGRDAPVRQALNSVPENAAQASLRL